MDGNPGSPLLPPGHFPMALWPCQLPVLGPAGLVLTFHCSEGRALPLASFSPLRGHVFHAVPRAPAQPLTCHFDLVPC